MRQVLPGSVSSCGGWRRLLFFSSVFWKQKSWFSCNLFLIFPHVRVGAVDCGFQFARLDGLARKEMALFDLSYPPLCGVCGVQGPEVCFDWDCGKKRRKPEEKTMKALHWPRSVLLTISLLVLAVSGYGQTSMVTLLEPHVFTRVTEAPVQKCLDFDIRANGKAVLRIAKSGLPAGKRVSALDISLNNAIVVAPQSVNQNVHMLEVPVPLSSSRFCTNSIV